MKHSKPKYMIKTMTRKTALLMSALLLFSGTISLLTLPAHAAVTATLGLSGSGLIKGCPSNIGITFDTGGNDVLAIDSVVNITGSATLNSASLGAQFPLQANKELNAGQLKLSGARNIGSGSYKGTGTFGTFSLTPDLSTTSLTLGFAGAGISIADTSYVNVYSSSTGIVLPVADRYNSDISGGFCTPDTQAPNFNLTSPTANSNYNPADSDITFILSDNRTGVNISTLNFSVNGSTISSGNYSSQENSGSYQITYNPPVDFVYGSTVSVAINNVCDNNTPANCLTQTKSFNVESPGCGNGIVDAGESCDDGGGNDDACPGSCSAAYCGDGYTYFGVEACDDGNNVSKDGCSATCVFDAAEGTTVEVEKIVEVPADCPQLNPSAPEEGATTVVEVPVYVTAESMPDEQVRDEVTSASALVLKETVEVESYDAAIPATQAEATDCATTYPDGSEDSDSDGLSDRTECFIGTDPSDTDTDSDGCTDGREVNELTNKNPLNSGDCSTEYIANVVEKQVTITNPKAGWIVNNLEINGITPEGTNTVVVVAVPSESGALTNLTASLANLISNPKNGTGDLELARAAAIAYANEYDMLTLGKAASDIDVDAIKLAQAGETPNLSFLEANLIELNGLSSNAVHLGQSSSLADSPTDLGGLYFSIEAVVTPDTDGRWFDLIATSQMDDGTKISSLPIRIFIDTESLAATPVPQSIGGVPVTGSPVALGNGIFIKNAIAQADGSYEIQITDDQPTIEGSTEFGSQVYAVWESLVLSSSVIADSDEGSFAIQAPKTLAANTGHKVSLYAVKADESGNKLRSDSVDVYFRVNTPAFPWAIVLWPLIGLLVLATLTFGFMGRMGKKRNIAQDLADKNRSTSDYGSSVAPEHAAKQEEVEAAFRK